MRSEGERSSREEMAHPKRRVSAEAIQSVESACLRGTCAAFERSSGAVSPRALPLMPSHTFFFPSFNSDPNSLVESSGSLGVSSSEPSRCAQTRIPVETRELSTA